MISFIANPAALVGAKPLHLLSQTALRKRELAYGRQSRLITPPAKRNRAFPTGNALLYISLSSVVFGRVRPFRAHPVFVLRKNLRNKS